MLKKLVYSVILLFSSTSLSGQIILLHENVKADSIKNNYGPNYNHFVQLSYAYGLLLGKADEKGGAIKQPQSFFLTAGLKYKRKITTYYALVFDLDYHLQNFSLRQDSTKVIPDKALHDREKLIFNNIEVSFLNRFNFSRRGNTIGNYIDIGIYGNYMFRSSHITYDKSSDATLSNYETVIRHKGLVFANSYNYGLMARCGHRALALIASYRLSDLFKAKHKLYPELPRFMVGIEWSTM